MRVEQIPLLNAVLNSITTVLLLAGFAAIKAGRRSLHRVLMSAAFGTSTLFLAGYLIHKFIVKKLSIFPDLGWIRTLYLVILISHTVLAVVNLPLILRTLYLAVQGRFEEHKKMAHWAYPVWLYVSVTGVVVYLMLYQWFPVRH